MGDDVSLIDPRENDMKTSLLFAAVFAVIVLAACGPDSGGSGDPNSNTDDKADMSSAAQALGILTDEWECNGNCRGPFNGWGALYAATLDWYGQADGNCQAYANTWVTVHAYLFRMDAPAWVDKNNCHSPYCSYAAASGSGGASANAYLPLVKAGYYTVCGAYYSPHGWTTYWNNGAYAR
jgi:hypothetical protein